jgi:hypothetical protein
VVYPESKDAKQNTDGVVLAEYTAKILWDWQDPQTVSRPGYARVQVRLSRRSATADKIVGEAKR